MTIATRQEVRPILGTRAGEARPLSGEMLQQELHGRNGSYGLMFEQVYDGYEKPSRRLVMCEPVPGEPSVLQVVSVVLSRGNGHYTARRGIAPAQ